MKVYVTEDEWYPIYSVCKSKNDRYKPDLLDLPDELVNRYNRIADEFEDVWEEIGDAIREARDAR